MMIEAASVRAMKPKVTLRTGFATVVAPATVVPGAAVVPALVVEDVEDVDPHDAKSAIAAGVRVAAPPSLRKFRLFM
jgi:hypothetical protein